jgi:[acyl-carrier-protein] S-malonyltransferase
MPAAREAWERVAAQVPVPNGEDYYARNRDLYAEPYEEVREKIERELRQAAADRAFTSWLDRRHAALVRLMPGFEHPADPRHPDATHRH